MHNKISENKVVVFSIISYPRINVPFQTLFVNNGHFKIIIMFTYVGRGVSTIGKVLRITWFSTRIFPNNCFAILIKFF